MKTFNIRYRSVEKLKDFLLTHKLSKQETVFVQIFTSIASSSHILTLVKALQELLPLAVIVGCSSDGEIIEGKVLSKNTVISISQFDKTKIKFLKLQSTSNAYEQGQHIANSLVSKGTKALILLATFKDLNAQSLLDGIYNHKSVHHELVISGALAGDNGKFKNSFVFDSEMILEEGILAIAFSGESLRASNHYIHDWEPISRKFRVDAVDNNIVEKVDGKPIKDLYSQYVGLDENASIPLYSLQFPFVLKRGEKHISKLVIEDPDDGSLRFTSNIGEGDILQIAFANIEKVRENAQYIFESVASEPAQTLFVYASSARRRFLEHFCNKELESLPNIANMSGFFGFSEFFANKRECNLFSQSLTVLALSESDIVKDIAYPHKKETMQDDLDYKTVKVLSSIAQVSSNELEDVNKKLEMRVQEGIRENRKKDSIMIHNSKLAQLGEMMGLIAHQWRQPLSAISATSTGMQIKFELDSWTPEYVQTSLNNIEEYVLHLSDTINDFTDFFKPTKKKQTTTVREIIKKALFIMSPLLTKDNILVIKKYDSDNSIETYPNEVIQVLLNLIKNADNALKKLKISNPEIYINEYAAHDKNIIEISDNAGGIDEAIIERIFEPYFSTKNAENSMGLGLYMSKFIIEDSCGGTLSVQNAKDGAKFTITLDRGTL